MSENSVDDRVASFFPGRCIRSSSETYFDVAVTPDVVDFCDQNGIAILGFEGFLSKANHLYPQLDQIADFSSVRAPTWDEFVASCNSSARNILLKWSKTENLMINFTFSQRTER